MLRIELTQYETRGDFHVIFTFGGARQTTICAIVIIVREYKVPFIFPHFLEHVEIMRVRTKSSTPQAERAAPTLHTQMTFGLNKRHF